MTTETTETTENQPPTDPTDPAPPTKPIPGKVEPANWHTEDASEAPVDGLLADKPTTKPGQVKPNNWHTESEPAN